MERFSIISFGFGETIKFSSMIVNGQRYIIDCLNQDVCMVYVDPSQIHHVKNHLFDLFERDVQIVKGGFQEILCEEVGNDLHVKWFWYFEEGFKVVFSVNEECFRDEVREKVSFLIPKYNAVMLSLYAHLPCAQEPLEESQDTCVICLKYPYLPVVTKCDHVFCLHCISTWRSHKQECPSCKTKF